MSINLNDDSFNQKESSVVILNEGVPGIVEDVTYSVSKKKADDKPNAPEFKVTFKDAKGGSVDMSFWVAEATSYNTEEEAVKKQGTLLKHLIHAVYGSDYSFPSFANKTDMLNGCMKLLMEGSKSGNKYRIFTNYGTTGKPSKYLGIRGWVPCVEPMTVALADTRLKAGNIENMVRLEADKPTAPASADSLLDTDDDWA